MNTITAFEKLQQVTFLLNTNKFGQHKAADKLPAECDNEGDKKCEKKFVRYWGFVSYEQDRKEDRSCCIMNFQLEVIFETSKDPQNTWIAECQNSSRTRRAKVALRKTIGTNFNKSWTQQK